MARKKKKGRPWADHYTRQAQKERYPARSVYKLKEIQQKLNILKPNDRVLDLGCAPGSWLALAAEIVGSGGQVVGLDLQKVTTRLPGHVKTFEGDIFDLESGPDVGKNFDVVLSDMAPATTGNKNVDVDRSHALCEAALAVAQERLKPGGTFVCKIFQGAGIDDFAKTVKECFKRFKYFKPQSSRKASKEIFIIALDKKLDKEPDKK